MIFQFFYCHLIFPYFFVYIEPLAAKILITEIYQYIRISIFTTDRSTLMKTLFWYVKSQILKSAHKERSILMQTFFKRYMLGDFFLVFRMGRLNPVSKVKFDQISHVTFFDTLSNSLLYPWIPSSPCEILGKSHTRSHSFMLAQKTSKKRPGAQILKNAHKERAILMRTFLKGIYHVG